MALQESQSNVGLGTPDPDVGDGAVIHAVRHHAGGTALVVEHLDLDLRALGQAEGREPGGMRADRRDLERANQRMAGDAARRGAVGRAAQSGGDDEPIATFV